MYLPSRSNDLREQCMQVSPPEKRGDSYLSKKKKAQNQPAKLIFSKWGKILWYNLNFFNKFLKTWSWTSWQKKSGDLDLEDRIWRLEFGKTQFSCFEAAIWRMNFKACTFERLALIFGFGRGAQVVKTSPFWKWIYTAQASTLGVFIFCFGTLQALGSHQKTFLEEGGAFLNNANQDSETTTFLAPIRCCVTATLAARTFWQSRQTFT